MFLINHIRNFYGRFERPISSFSLIFGFVFDALTLKRVDTLFENVWVLVHLLIIGIFIALIHIQHNEIGAEHDPQKAHFWYVNILQFFFGGILSTYLVFYFRSTDIFVTWPFIALLVLAFIANESFKKYYIRLSFQISLFFLSIYSFTIFLVPVLMHQIGTYVFLLSGLISLILITIFLFILFRLIKQKNTSSKKLIISLILSIFILINFLYFTNLIPPIPLSIKDSGIYHLIERNQNGNLEITSENKAWWEYWKLYPNYMAVSGSPVYAFSAVFSPTNLNLTIVHEWQHYDEIQKKWITQSRINLSVVGGRDGGFRTYSKLWNLTPGKWRVNIETKQNQIIGNIRFNLVQVDTEPAFTTTVLSK